MTEYNINTQPQNIKTLSKMKTTSKMETTSKMKMTSKNKKGPLTLRLCSLQLGNGIVHNVCGIVHTHTHEAKRT